MTVPLRTRQPKKRILIVDDHPILRRGLAALLDQEPGLTVCGQAATVAEAKAALAELKPDLVIVDLLLGEESGLGLVQYTAARYPKVLVVVLSMQSEALYAGRALRAGARGFIQKAAKAAAVVRAIHSVLEGAVYLSEQMTRNFLVQARELRQAEALTAEERLTKRELQILRAMGQGQSGRAIAQSLDLSIKTVAAHRENIKRKLALTDTRQLALYATQWFQQATASSIAQPR